MSPRKQPQRKTEGQIIPHSVGLRVPAQAASGMQRDNSDAEHDMGGLHRFNGCLRALAADDAFQTRAMQEFDFAGGLSQPRLPLFSEIQPHSKLHPAGRPGCRELAELSVNLVAGRVEPRSRVESRELLVIEYVAGFPAQL
jgi:hypothetical protein